MKLCWLIPSDRSGGISPVALSCCQQSAQAGYDTTMLMLGTRSNYDRTSFPIISLELPGGAPEAPQRLMDWLNSNPQDVLLFNGCGELDSVIPYLPTAVKCVFVVHDTIPDYWRNALKQEENLEAIVAVSEAVASKFRHRLKHPNKLSVVHNGCVFPEKPELTASRADDLIFLGGDNPTKGAFDVLQVWRELSNIGFTGNLHWFGKVTPDFQAKITALPGSERIQVYGHVSRDVIFAKAASAKVLLMLSRVEPFGMATIEAMSMGCVPIAWDVTTGTKEIVTANKTGLFIPLGQTKRLAKTVVQVCENHQTYCADVIDHARTHFEEAVMWKRYEALIQEIARMQPIERTQCEQQPAPYYPPSYRFQRIAPQLRAIARNYVGRSPTLGYWLRDLRGW